MNIVLLVLITENIRVGLHSIIFVFLLLCFTGYADGSNYKNKVSSSIALSNAPVKFATANQEIKPTPVYIKLEVEDFANVGAEGSASAWQQNMSWHPQWSRGGASGWWGVKGLAAAASGEITREIFIPQNGEYRLWMRYQDYTGKAEFFDVAVNYTGGISKAEFGRADVNRQPQTEFRWSYAWDKKILNLKKGVAKISIALGQTAEVPRDIDALILTNDADWNPGERGFPPQAYSNYLLKWAQTREPLKPLIEANKNLSSVPKAWVIPKTAGRDFWYLGAAELVSGFPFPINIRPEVDNPNTVKALVERYKTNPQSVPIFNSPVSGIQIPVGQVGELLQSENPMRRYILANKRPFVIVGNYGSAGKIPNSYRQLEQIFGSLWLGIVSGENSYLNTPLYPENIPVDDDFKDANYRWLLTGGKSARQQLLGADWASTVPNPFEKTILALSVGTAPHAHQLAEAGANTLAAESTAAMPYFQGQAAFVRGAGRQYNKPWAWYFGASFGSAIRTFTSEGAYIIDLDGLKINSRNATIGPSLAHIRRAVLFSYLQGASFFHPEQGYNLFNTNGELNPMGWAYDEMLRLAAKHPERGVVNTPVALLLDKAHGWDKYTYNGMRIWDKKPLDRADQMINQFFNVAYFPFPKNEGDAANDLNVPFPNGYFGDVFDVLVTSPTRMDALQNYPAVVCLGDMRLDQKWAERLKKYVADGGTLVINAEQVVAGFDESFLGVKLQNRQKEASAVVCERDNETIAGTPFPYREAIAVSARVIARAANGDPIAFLNKVGKGQIILTTPSYLMGHDEVAMPYLAHLMLEITSGLQPVEVRGDCQYFVNLRPDGYVVTLSNNKGLVKLSDSPAKMDLSKTVEVALRIKDKPLATEDWLGENPQSWNFPGEWLPEYTHSKPLSWQPDGKSYKTSVKLLPGEIRAYFIKTKTGVNQ